jgi:hypothetical protein
MRSKWVWQRAAMFMLLGSAAAGLIGSRLQAVPRERQEAKAAPVVALTLSSQPPKGATVLFGGKEDQLHANWVKRYTNDPSNWTVDREGVATPQKSDLTSKQEYGDCFVHVEFRCPADVDGKPIGHGNSGVGFQGRYEVQILDSYGQKPEAHGCGALYSQKPPLVTASRKAGEWQTYDIFFRAPRFDGEGKVTEKPRATVIQNGIVVQNNEEFTGMTGIQYGQYKEMTKTGPLVLQGDHDSVQFRNVWIIPM